jgi:molybdate transport system substrate-binding protein
MARRLFLLFATVCMVEVGTQDKPIVVSAAISLTNALREIESAYRATGGGPLTFNFAASNVLARQIVNGAPVDIFVSADSAQMDVVERAGAIDRQTRRDLLKNRLVVVTPAGRTVPITNASDLLNPRVRRIAVGDPAAVPAGVYARSYLELDRLWEAVQPKLVPLANVRAALEAAASGSVDAAIVYQSDAASSKRVQLAYVFPANGRLPIVYPAAITARSKNRAGAERFMAFLRTPEARKIFERHGFIAEGLTTETQRPQRVLGAEAHSIGAVGPRSARRGSARTPDASATCLLTALASGVRALPQRRPKAGVPTAPLCSLCLCGELSRELPVSA